MLPLSFFHDWNTEALKSKEVKGGGKRKENNDNS
jgi:hypothetical protein